jgi:hypothetical protein
MKIDFESIERFQRKVYSRNIQMAIALLFLSLGLFLAALFWTSGTDNTLKTVFSCGGGVFSTFLVWPIKELVMCKNRSDLIHLNKQEYKGPPEADPDRCIQIKKRLDDILMKNT